MGAGLITSKIIAIYVGPTGMGLVGNLRNFLSSIQSIATLGLQDGIVKYIAERKNDKSALSVLLSTLFFVLTLISLAVSTGLYFFSENINNFLFGVHFQYGNIIQMLAFALPFYVYSILLIAIANGLGTFKNVIRINIIGNIIGLILSVVLISMFKTLGALAALIITPSVLFFVALYYVQQELSLWQTIRQNSVDFVVLKQMIPYSFMFFVSAVIGPFVFLEIRNYIIHTLGNDAAGYWEAMSRISTYYLLFVSTLASVYFFPRLAITKSVNETRSILWSYYKWILTLFIGVLAIIYMFRNLIVQILFTEDFLPVIDLFFWQLLGDVFKVASLILGYQFLAKKMTAHFILTEVMSLSLSYFLSLYLISYFEIKGVVMAHAFTYIIYFAVLLLIFRKTLFGVKLQEK